LRFRANPGRAHGFIAPSRIACNPARIKLYQILKWLETKKGPFHHFAAPSEAAMPYPGKEGLDNPGVRPSLETMETLMFTKDLGKDNRIMDEAWTRAKLP
jgi:hypothetical protein